MVKQWIVTFDADAVQKRIDNDNWPADEIKKQAMYIDEKLAYMANEYFMSVEPVSV